MESDSDNEIQKIELLHSVLELDNNSQGDANSICSEHICSDSTNITSGVQNVSKIEVALALNKLLDEKLKRLEMTLMKLQSDCRERLSNLQAMPNTSSNEKCESFLYLHCGKPYFKDRAFFPAPDNCDTTLMKSLGFFDICSVTSVPGWTVRDKKLFLRILHRLSCEARKKELNSQLLKYQRDAKEGNERAIQKKIDAIRRKILALKYKTLDELALPLDVEYDWDLISTEWDRHSPQEYRALWKLFLHPSINKNHWSREEHFKLQNIAQSNNLQNWKQIAQELNTGRTGYQCFIYYKTNMGKPFSGKRWSKEEEEYLKRLVNCYKQDNHIPWGLIAPKMPNRTKLQIYNKYLRTCEKKGRFVPEEDAVLLTCVKKYGEDFKKISPFLNGRSAQQLRTRYNVLCNSNRVSAVWTVQEDKKLVQLMSNKDSGVSFADIVNNFPGKDRAVIRTRYITLTKWMKLNPKKDLKYAPRRRARRLPHGQESTDLSSALNTLRSRIETEFISGRGKKVTVNSSEEVIEDAIVMTLLNENISLQVNSKEVEPNVCSISNSNTAQNLSITNLRKLLILLNAKLNKDKFVKNTELGKKYSSLIDDTTHTPQMQVRSYSKKSNITVIKFKEEPDIWGSNILGMSASVLPPHLQTIIGCKRLMGYINACNNIAIDDWSTKIETLRRVNSFFREDWSKLMSRFELLFLWPMLLSSTHPKANGNVKLAACRPPKFPVYNGSHSISDSMTGVVIPDIKVIEKGKKRLRSSADVQLKPNNDHYASFIISEDSKFMKPF